ncbi:unnamed protein product [Closterium sp. NIES-54]
MTTLRVLLHIAPQRDYSSPTTASLSRLMLPYLFPDLATFATVADLVAHLNTSDARYRTALPTEDHFLSLCPTELTIDLLEERLTTAEKSILAVGASRGDRRTPFFEGCSPVPLLPSVASAAAVDLVGTEEVGAASAPSGRRRNSKGKGSRVVEGTAGAAAEAVEEAEWVAVEVGVVPGVGASMAAVEVVEAAAEVVEEAAEVVEAAAVVVEVAPAMVLVEVQPRSMEALVVASASSSRVPVRPCRPSSFVSGTLGMGGLGFPDAVELPRWHDLLRQNVAIFDLDFDAILAAMYALTDSAEGDCYLSVPPDPCIEAVALGASASAAPGAGESAAPGISESALSGTAPTEALHTFTLDSGASRSFFRDSTTLMPLSRPVAVSLADPSGGPVLAHSSTVLPCPAALSGLLSRLHLPSFSTNLVSGADLQDAWVAASSQVFAAASRSSPASTPCSCRPLSHETLLWHHHLGHPSLPRLRGMASRTLVSSLPRSLPPLPPGPAPSSVPCVEGRQRAAPHSSTFPQTEAPLQTLHMDVWGPARVRGKGHERYFLLVVDDYSRYTIVFPLRSKGEVPQVLIDWIHGARRQLSERFGSDLPVLRLHLDRGGLIPLPGPSPLLPPGAEGTSAVSALSGGTARPRPYCVPLLQQFLGLPPSPGPPSPFLSPPPGQSQSPLQPSSPLPGPSPYSGSTRGLTERREPESRPVSSVSRSASPVRTACTGCRTPRPPPVPGTHSMSLRPSTAPQRVPLPSPPASSLPDGPDPESDSLRTASPTAMRFLATFVTDPLFESIAASALVAELVDCAAACRLDYAAGLVAESASAPVCPPSVGEAIEGPYSSQWHAAMDAEMASWMSTGTYVDEVPPPGANIISGM